MLLLVSLPAVCFGHHHGARDQEADVNITLSMEARAARLVGEARRSIQLPRDVGRLKQVFLAEAWSLALMERLASLEAQMAASDRSRGGRGSIVVARRHIHFPGTLIR